MITDLSLKLFKMHGTGNDFLILNLVEEKMLRLFEKRVSKDHRSDWARRVCDRHFGVGADGLLFLEDDDSLDFQWDFYNSDGSYAEMCGNAARCAALFATTYNIADENMSFRTLAGPISARVNGDHVAVEINKITADTEEVFLFQDQKVPYQRVHSGVPHSVIRKNSDEKLASKENKQLAVALRSDASHGSRGSNVTFYKPIGDKHIKSVSFERGVENFTLSCGTGVLAAGFHFCQSEGIDACDVTVPGGQLRVQLIPGKKPTLEGPAKFVAEVSLNMELF